MCDFGHDDVHSSMILSCLHDAAQLRFEQLQQDPHGLRIDDFVRVLSDMIYEYADASGRKQLETVAALAELKAFLFVLFRAVDFNDDGYVSWTDLTEYVIDERIRATQTAANDDRLEEYAVIGTHRYNPVLAITEKHEGGQKAAPVASDAREAEEQFLPIEPLKWMRYVPSLNRIVGVGRNGAAYVMDAQDYSVNAAIIDKSPVEVIECGPASSNLLLTAHRNRAVKVWASKECRKASGKLELSLEYEHHSATVQSAARWCEGSSELVLTGGAYGDMRLWRFTADLMADYRRGEPSAFGKILVHQWDEGEWHRGLVSDFCSVSNTGPMVSCSHDGTACLFDLETQTKIRTLRHRKGLYSVTVNTMPTAVLCCGGFEFTPYLWDLASRSTRPTLLNDSVNPHKHAVVSVVALTGLPVIASCDASAKVKLWDLRTHRCFQTIAIEKHQTLAEKKHAASSASGMTFASPSNTLCIAGRALFEVGPQARCDPMNCYTSDVVGVAFDERSGNILTAHEDCVVIWSSQTGTILAVQRFDPKIPLLPLKENAKETVRCMVVPPRGQKYYLGTSYGRVTLHKESSGEAMKDSGRIHDGEVTALAIGGSTFDSEYVVSIGMDGWCCITSESLKLPPRFALPPTLTSTCVAFLPSKKLLVFGTVPAALISVDAYTVMSKGVVSRDAIAPPDDYQDSIAEVFAGTPLATNSALCGVVAIVTIDALQVVAAADSCGSVVFLPVGRGGRMAGKELARVKLPSRRDANNAERGVCATVMHAHNFGGRQTVFVGDEVGRVTFLRVDNSILSLSSKVRQSSVTVQRVVCLHHGSVTSMALSLQAQCLLTAGTDQRVRIASMEGDDLGYLCYGRQLNSLWNEGSAPPFAFPDVTSVVAAQKLRSMRTIRMIQSLLRRLRQRVISKKERSLQALLNTPATADTTPEPETAESRSQVDVLETPSPQKKPPSTANSERPSALPAPLEASESESSTHEVANRSTTSTDDLCDKHIRHPAERKAHVVFCPQPPNSSKVAPFLYLPPSNFAAVPPAFHSPDAVPAPNRSVFTPQKSFTARRIAPPRLGDQLIVLSSVTSSHKAVECSMRAKDTTLKKQDDAEEAHARMVKGLSDEEIRLRHAIGAEDRKKHHRLVGELDRIHREEVYEAQQKEARRQASLRGPPLPAFPVSRRPQSARM